MIERLLPVGGCQVGDRRINRVGQVRQSRVLGGEPEVQVRWQGETEPKWVPMEHIKCGFLLGMDVQEIPRSFTRSSLGEGVVLETRDIGAREQVLVEYVDSGQRIWIPYENLKSIKSVAHRFRTRETGDPGQAERFRLRNLACALEMWNENTGALSHLDIDPLPHQIHLVHRILASGNLNWMIADDVGLGKTVEVGMLMSALLQRGNFRRILLVTPAGLVRQWQEEMHHKFGMSEFQIYGADFEVNEDRHWRLHNHVIASIDRLKGDKHLESIMQTDPWDLIVFDEAHRLSRRQYGKKYVSADRFKLAAQLRKKTDSMLLLTATPHQGMQDKFQALLEILRPDLKPQINTLARNPEILGDMIIRNPKALATDVDGNFIFKAKVTRAIEVPVGEDEAKFDVALQKYLRKGYAASKGKNKTARAIGFVMTVYRKLAASSIAAIERALTRRLERLKGEFEELDTYELEDERFEAELEELNLDSEKETREEFFRGEIELVDELLAKARAVLNKDEKLASFLNAVVGAVNEYGSDERLLVFTEYRSTQDYLVAALKRMYGEQAVVQIHGGMNYVERGEAITLFEDSARFLVSTEAGGEGLNLQKRCHIMVNYDLPWNPMRLVQRVGRLYRYGQDKNVVVLNMHAPSTLDARIMQHMYGRIDQVVRDMSTVGGEYSDGLHDEIMGQVADVLDIQSILSGAVDADVARTDADLTEALMKAKHAVKMQQELFEHVTGFDPNETKGEVSIGVSHVRSFVEGMCNRVGILELEKSHGGRMIHLSIPPAVQDALETRRKRLQITYDRQFASSRADVEVMDFHSPLLRYLVAQARAYSFGGMCAPIGEIDGKVLFTAVLRWQNDQGMRLRQEFGAVLIDDDGRATMNPPAISEWLTRVAEDHHLEENNLDALDLLAKVQGTLDKRLAAVSNLSLHPESRQLVSAAFISSGSHGATAP